MASSIRQLAVDAIITKLGNITTGNGYNKNITSKRIYTAKDNPTSLPTPAIVLVQGEEEIVNQHNERYECHLELDVAFVEGGAFSDPAAEGNKFIQDIQKAMGVEYNISAPQWNGSGSDVPSTVVMRELNSVLQVMDSVPNIIIGRVTYLIRYTRSVYDPTYI